MKRCLFIFLLAGTVSDIFSQTLTGGPDAVDILFDQCVKSCEEFMERFNGEELFPGLDSSDVQSGFKNFVMLFDSNLIKKKGKDVFLKEVKEFHDSVLTNKTKLKYESRKWYAEECISFKYGGKKVNISLILHTEITPRNLPCWTIVGVKGMGQLGISDSTGHMAISPEQHEAEFIELESDFKNASRHFSQFRSAGTRLDALGYFFALVENGVVTFNERLSTTFHFFDVPSYAFCVTHHNRKTSNTGWLISKYEKMDENNKPTIINKLLSK